MAGKIRPEKTFREVGQHVFPLAKATRTSISYPDT